MYFQVIGSAAVNHSNVIIVRGCEGECPSNICRNNNLFNVVVTHHNLERMTNCLNMNNVESAYVGGWLDHRGDFVLQCNGAVNPWCLYSNNTMYAVCQKYNKHCAKREPVKQERECIEPIVEKIKCRPLIRKCWPRKETPVTVPCTVPAPARCRRIRNPASPKRLCEKIERICRKPVKARRCVKEERKIARIPVRKPIQKIVTAVARCNRPIAPVFPRRRICVRRERKVKPNKTKMLCKLAKALCSKYRDQNENRCVERRRYTCEEVHEALIKILPQAYCDRNILHKLISATGNFNNENGVYEEDLNSILENVMPVLKRDPSATESSLYSEYSLFKGPTAA